VFAEGVGGGRRGGREERIEVVEEGGGEERRKWERKRKSVRLLPIFEIAPKAESGRSGRCPLMPDWDDLLAYKTRRKARIRDWRLGAFFRSMQFGVFVCEYPHVGQSFPLSILLVLAASGGTCTLALTTLSPP
jgi:hypothetical protein